MMWGECSYEVKCKILHKLVHEYRIAEADLPGIMALLGFDTSGLLVYNSDGSPGAIHLYRGEATLDPLSRMRAVRRVADDLEREITEVLIHGIHAKLMTLGEVRRCDYPDEFWAAFEMCSQWMHKHCPPAWQSKFPHRPWPAWLPRKLRRPLPERPLPLLMQMAAALWPQGVQP
jgi:hypothetical protein